MKATVPVPGCSRDRFMLPCLLAGLAGAAWAGWLYGWRVLDPHSVQWLLHGDPAQHYAGLVFFLAQPWHWPPGAIVLAGAGETSVVFTDSIPVLALFAKAVGLPAGVQYFGAWILSCHALMAAGAVILLRRLGAGVAAAVIGALFFMNLPILLMRAYGHEALMGQFLLVAALTLACGPCRPVLWTILLVVAVLVHPYLAAMVSALACAALITSLQRRVLPAPGLIRIVAGWLVSVLVAGWLGGYFVGSADRSGDGFGYYSANALTWFDPMDWAAFLRFYGRDPAGAGEWSAFLPALGQATHGQYEGFAWLGAGLLSVLALALVTTVVRCFQSVRSFRPAAPPAGGSIDPGDAQAVSTRRVPGWLWITCIAMALFALSARPSFGPHIVPDWSLGDTAARLTGIFRASGRFIWPLTLLLVAWAIARVATLRAGLALLCAALLLQACDLWPKTLELRERFRSGPPGIQNVPEIAAWRGLLHTCPRLQWLDDPTGSDRWVVPALMAAHASAAAVDLPLARRSAAVATEQARIRSSLRQGDGWRDDTVYVVLQDREDGHWPGRAAPPAFRQTVLDGYVIVAAPRCLHPSPDRGDS